MPNIPLVIHTYNHIFVKIKHKIQSEKCENLRLIKSRIFRNNIRVKIEEMRRFKLHIPTNISFGTEMKFKIEGTIKYTSIPMATKVFMKVIGYPHQQFTALTNHPVIIS